MTPTSQRIDDTKADTPGVGIGPVRYTFMPILKNPAVKAGSIV